MKMPSSIALNCDCMEYMKSLPDKSITLCVADPPYGIGITGNHWKSGGGTSIGSSKPFGSKGNGLRRIQERIIKTNFYPVFDDSSPPNAEVFRELERISKFLIIWGGNFFLEHLGPASCMIVWDKKRRGMSQADCEIAWTNLKGQSRVFEYRWNGMLQENMKEKEVRMHATQKPVDLYRYCYLLAGLKPGDTILDPYLGSGSSRIGAYDLGIDFVGCEISKTYFDLQEERFERHTAQGNLFLQNT